jgi:hypothetical protein
MGAPYTNQSGTKSIIERREVRHAATTNQGFGDSVVVGEQKLSIGAAFANGGSVLDFLLAVVGVGHFGEGKVW